MTYENLIDTLEYIRPFLFVALGFSVMLLIHLITMRHLREGFEETILQQSDRIRRLINRPMTGNSISTFSTTSMMKHDYIPITSYAQHTLTEMPSTTAAPCSTWGDVKKSD